MRNRRGVLNHVDLQSCGLQTSNGRLPPWPGTLDDYVYFSYAVILCLFGHSLCCHLSSIGRRFTGAFETYCSPRCPTDNAALLVCYTYDRIIKCRVNVSNGIIYILFFLPFCPSFGALGHLISLLNLQASFTFSLWLSSCRLSSSLDPCASLRWCASSVPLREGRACALSLDNSLCLSGA